MYYFHVHDAVSILKTNTSPQMKFILFIIANYHFINLPVQKMGAALIVMKFLSSH